MLEINAVINGGTVFEKRISSFDKGLTKSWLNVPNSLSLAIDRADNNRHKTIDNITIKLTVKNHLYSMFSCKASLKKA